MAKVRLVPRSRKTWDSKHLTMAPSYLKFHLNSPALHDLFSGSCLFPSLRRTLLVSSPSPRCSLPYGTPVLKQRMNNRCLLIVYGLLRHSIVLDGTARTRLTDHI